MKTYYMLTKPGIIMGNIVTTAAGFALASKGQLNYWLFLVTLLGLGFVIASAGVFNNYIDRVMDSKMARTKKRPFVTGSISIPYALTFGALLGLIGISLLALYTNLLTVVIAFSGFFVYLVLYAFWKYRSFYGTLVGSIAGAVPPVVGYCSVSNRLDIGAGLLFIILVLWQMPHFFAIAIYRLEEYRAASIPVLPLTNGIYATKLHMLFYILAFMVSTLLLTLTGYMGLLYLVTATLLSILWLGLGMKGLAKANDQLWDARWAKQMFVYSLVVIMGLCLTISIDVIP